MDSNLAVDIRNRNKELPAHLIVGLGVSGNSCARYFQRKGIKFAVTDSRAEPPLLDQFVEQCAEAPMFLGGFDAAAIAAAEELIVAPGISLSTPEIQEAMQAGKQIVGDIELFSRDVDAPVIAITGTNGKSTLTELVAHMARVCGMNVRMGGNIGVPALDLLALDEETPDLYVLEISSFQLETTYNLNACAATVLNISPDHMDRYADLPLYGAAKQRIFSGDGAMVLNLDDPLVMAMARENRHCVTFSTESSDADFFLLTSAGETWLMGNGKKLLNTKKLRIRGRHNYANALAALALGDAFGLPMEGMLSALPTYQGLSHRMQWVGEFGGVTWINDSKGTNVGATLAAVLGINTPVVLIAGGEGKGADFSPLGEIAANLRALVVMGRDGPGIAKVLRGKTPIEHAVNMVDAVECAAKLAQPGDSVLLSPACASFDMYKNFKARGNDFVKTIEDKYGVSP